MKTFAKIIVSALFLFAYAPAFAHGGGHGMGGMGGMGGTHGMNNTGGPVTYNVAKTNTNTNSNTNTNTNSHSMSTKTNGHFNFGHKLFLRTEQRILAREIFRIEAEILRLRNRHDVTSPRLFMLEHQIARLELKLFRVKTDLGHDFVS
jgi:hypothetical protein